MVRCYLIKVTARVNSQYDRNIELVNRINIVIALDIVSIEVTVFPYAVSSFINSPPLKAVKIYIVHENK